MVSPLFLAVIGWQQELLQKMAQVVFRLITVLLDLGPASALIFLNLGIGFRISD
jgi:hypothetical protein